MKTSRFNLNHLLKILFANKSIDKICWMLGFGLFIVSLTCYVLTLTAIISNSQTVVNSQSYILLLKATLIFLGLAFLFGTHASIWLILAFHNKKRLISRKRTLKILCLVSLNFLAYYTIDFLIEKFLEAEETIAEVLLTHDHLVKKTNWVWQALLIFFAMISIVGFSPMIFLTCWILSESHYVYFEESTIRDRIALVLESLFCLFPVFSLINLFATTKNNLFIAWLEENAEAEGQKNEFQLKVYWNRSANLLICLVYWLSIVLFFVWCSLTVTFLTTHLIGFAWKNFFILFLWPLTSLFLFNFTIHKKYLWEMDLKMPLWTLVFEILTLNIFLMGVSLIFIYKNNQIAKNQNYQWKAELNRNFFWLILINTLVAYLLIIGGIVLIQIGKYQLEFNWFYANILMVIGAIVFCHLTFNIWKMTNYKIYFNNLIWWLVFDFLTINLMGLVFNLMSKLKKEKMRAELVWI